jgi:hypothetical protein
VLLAGALAAAALPAGVRAAVQVERAARVPRLSIDVWTNKEEGGVYRPGEGMKIFFRPAADSYVLIYNIDTEGFIHLVYPYGPDDAERLEGGRTYQIPSRRDPYDLVADGPPGIEYVVALAAPFPFQNLPWYLSSRLADEGPPEDVDADDPESGVIVGDPYVGMERIVRRIVPPGREEEVATADTYFYIERRVEYPRYVCADCHSHGIWFDPYVDVCNVFEIRIDATWARYAPLRSRTVRPRYYYMVRSGAPNRYRAWKERWSSLDGRSTLRAKFQVEDGGKRRPRREVIQRRTPPEFKDLRRPRPGRFLQGRDEVLKVRERREREQAARDREGRLRDRGRGAEERKPDAGRGRDADRPPARITPERPGRERRDRDDADVRERRRPKDRDDARQREGPKREEPKHEEPKREEPKHEEPKHEDRGTKERGEPPSKGHDRHDREDRGRGR